MIRKNTKLLNHDPLTNLSKMILEWQVRFTNKYRIQFRVQKLERDVDTVPVSSCLEHIAVAVTFVSMWFSNMSF